MAKKQAEETAVAVAAPAGVVAYDYGEHAGEGFERTTGSDLTIPFIGILQDMSPEVRKQTIEGVRPGMILNSVTREITPAIAANHEEGIVFLPVVKQNVFVEWVPRTKGGGLVAMHSPTSDLVLENLAKHGGRSMGPMPLGTVDKEGKGDTELVETVYVYGIRLDADGLTPADDIGGVISFTSTKMKVWRQWHTAMYSIKALKKPPLYAFRARLTTFLDHNKKNQEFWNFIVAPFGPSWAGALLNPAQQAEGALMHRARKYAEMINSGAAKADFSSQNAGGDTDPNEPPF